MSDLHAPTLRRVIEMLEGEIAEATAKRDAERRIALGQTWHDRMESLRAFRERLEREAEKAGG